MVFGAGLFISYLSLWTQYTRLSLIILQLRRLLETNPRFVIRGINISRRRGCGIDPCPLGVPRREGAGNS